MTAGPITLYRLAKYTNISLIWKHSCWSAQIFHCKPYWFQINASSCKYRPKVANGHVTVNSLFTMSMFKAFRPAISHHRRCRDFVENILVTTFFTALIWVFVFLTTIMLIIFLLLRFVFEYFKYLYFPPQRMSHLGRWWSR